MIDILYGLGAIGSIIGAVFSLRYANQAKRYATRAEIQIASKRRISELSQLELRWNDTYKALAVFGAGSRTTDLRGKDSSDAARKAQDYLEEVNRCDSSLQGVTDLRQRIEESFSMLEAFSAAKYNQDLKDTGTRLVNKLSDLNAAIGSSLITDKEKVIL